MTEGRLPLAVWGFVLAHEKERLFLIPLVKPVQGLVSNDIGGVSDMIYIHAVGEKQGVVIMALSFEDFEMVESRGGGFKMPFTNYGCLIAGFF